MVGDVDQLPSVGAGNILSDIIKSNTIKTIRLDMISQTVCRKYDRSDAHAVNKGMMPLLNIKTRFLFYKRKQYK